jgi:hypothetical protein
MHDQICSFLLPIGIILIYLVHFHVLCLKIFFVAIGFISKVITQQMHVMLMLCFTLSNIFVYIFFQSGHTEF